ncbi:unnamed protein product, partial [Notodromas monacha]
MFSALRRLHCVILLELVKSNHRPCVPASLQVEFTAKSWRTKNTSSAAGGRVGMDNHAFNRYRHLLETGNYFQWQLLLGNKRRREKEESGQGTPSSSAKCSNNNVAAAGREPLRQLRTQ